MNRSHGCYRHFGAIVQKEGGWNGKAAVRGAPAMALKCIKMGGEWTSRNLLTERLEFWHIKREKHRGLHRGLEYTQERGGICAAAQGHSECSEGAKTWGGASCREQGGCEAEGRCTDSSDSKGRDPH